MCASTRILVISAAIAFCLIAHGIAHATTVTHCGTTCSTDCVLGADIACQPGQDGITLTNGASLDMRDLSITCDNGYPGGSTDSCGNAVTMLSPNSRVFTSSTSSFRPSIVGVWNNAVDCRSQVTTTVKGISIRGYWNNAAITGCHLVLLNTIEGVPDPVGSFVDTTFWSWPTRCVHHPATPELYDVVQSNHLAGCNSAVTSIASALAVDDNTMDCRDNLPVLASFGCLQVNGPGTIRISNNVLTGDSRSVMHPQASSILFQNNLCKLSTMRGCAQCVSKGQCVPSATIDDL